MHAMQVLSTVHFNFIKLNEIWDLAEFCEN